MPDQRPHDWIVATLSVALALTLAFGIGFLAGQERPRSKAEMSAVCERLPRKDRTANCIALRSALATEASATRAFWGNIVSFGALVGSTAALFGLIVTFRQGQRAIGLASDANDIARDIGRAQARAYVVIPSLACRLTSAGSLTAIVKIHNSGASPARRLRWLYSAHVNAVSENGQNRSLVLGADRDLGRSHWRQDIGSAQTWTSTPLGVTGTSDAALASLVDGAVLIALTAKVALTYEDVFGASHHEEASFQGLVEVGAADDPPTALQRAHDTAFDEIVSQMKCE